MPRVGLQDPVLAACRVRRSARAKYLRLRVLSGGDVELVLPQRATLEQARSFLQSKAAWVRETRARALQQESRETERCRALPSRIELPAVGEKWVLRTRLPEGGSARLSEQPGSTLVWSGEANPDVSIYPLLRSWLIERAKVLLPPRLEAVSRTVGLTYRRVGVRWQKTRWGSCSNQQRISLNAKLLLLDPELVEYLFIHELCHTRHMDHSPRFWALVETLQPAWRVLDRRLRRASSSLPVWVHCTERKAG